MVTHVSLSGPGEPESPLSVTSTMRILGRGPSLLPLLLLLGLAACGAGGNGRQMAPLDGKDAVAVAIASDGEVRVVADAAQPWSLLREGLGRSEDTGAARVEIEVVEDGAVLRRLSIPRHTGRSRRDPGSPLQLLIRCLHDGERPILEGRCTGDAWLREYGCEASLGGRWPWDPGTAPLELLDLVGLALCASNRQGTRLEAQVAVVAKEGRPETTIHEVASLVADLLDVGVEAFDLGSRVSRCGHRPLGVVERALHFLASHQSPDGGWDPRRWPSWCGGKALRRAEAGAGDAACGIGATGLALTAFLGAGYTNRGDHDFAKTVARGGRHLKALQREDGTFEATGSRWRGRNHALATLALTQLYGGTGSPIWRHAAHRAQAALGDVWREEEGDVLATGYAALAILVDRLIAQDRRHRGEEAAWLLAGREVLTVDVLEACRRLAEGDTACEVAVGCAGCTLLGNEADARSVARSLGEVVDVIVENPLDDPAAAYLAAIAAYQVGGDTWKRNQHAWKDGILPAQREGPRCCLGGSWPATSSSVGGCLEATALFTMFCEIYYRYDRVVGHRR